MFVRVWEWSLNTNSSFPVKSGKVIVLSADKSLTAKVYVWSEPPSFIFGVVNVGLVIVLFVNVSARSIVAIVPPVFGRIKFTLSDPDIVWSSRVNTAAFGDAPSS